VLVEAQKARRFAAPPMRGVMRPSSIVRWILVVPSALVAWYFAFLVSVFAYLLGPCMNTDAPQPRFCEAAWFDAFKRGEILYGVGLSAVLVVAASAVMAPSHRTAVAWTAVGIGTIVASVMGYRAERFAEALVAIACGVLTALFVSRLTADRHAKVAHTNVVPNATRRL
jgi:hypothetical protein